MGPLLLIASVLWNGDPFITVDKVSLPAGGTDPDNIQLVLSETVRGCRTAGKPVIERKGTVIRVLPKVESGGRAPCSTSQKTEQVVDLGALSRGTYRVQVITEKSQVFKVLNVY